MSPAMRRSVAFKECRGAIQQVPLAECYFADRLRIFPKYGPAEIRDDARLHGMWWLPLLNRQCVL